MFSATHILFSPRNTVSCCSVQCQSQRTLAIGFRNSNFQKPKSIALGTCNARRCHCRCRECRKLSKIGKIDRSSVITMAAPETRADEEQALNVPSTSKSFEDQPINWRTTALAFIFPAVGGGLFGYDIGATSGALVSIKSAATSGTDWYQLSSFQSGLVVSLSLFGALAGSAAAFVVGDPLGRKKELLLASTLYCPGSAKAVSFFPAIWTMESLYTVFDYPFFVRLAKLRKLVDVVAAGVVCYNADSYNTLLLGRTLYGLGIGFAMHAAPAYIAETAPAKVRGLLISLKECLIVVGILSGYLASYLLIDDVGGWRTMYGLSVVPALALLFGMAWLPESPRWLVLSGAGKKAAQESIQKLRGGEANPSSINAEVDSICTKTKEGQKTAGFQELFQGRNLKALKVGMSLMLLQQITGQPSVLYYAAEIFQRAGFAGGQESTRISVFLGFFKLIATGFAVLKVESLGRRPLLIWGVSGMTLALLALGSSSTFFQGDLQAWSSVVALLLYVGAYQVSFGPISWLIVGEVFPLAVRGPASALATLTNFGSNFMVSLVLPSLQDGLGPGGTYLTFAAISVAAVVTIYNIVPETKGKTLEEIEAMWD